MERVLSHLREGVVRALINGAGSIGLVELPFDQFPFDEEPLDDVMEKHVGVSLMASDLRALVDHDGKRFASPLTALRYAIKHQRMYPLAVFFEINGQLWLLIGWQDIGARGLTVMRVTPEERTGKDCRFLVVDKSAD